MCEFYRDQMFEEVLIEPIMVLIVSFLKLLNSIPKCERQNAGGGPPHQSSKDRFREPFTETLFKNTERLQMTLRRALFTSVLLDSSSSGKETE